MFTLVNDQGGDWIALYKDGVLVDQGHSFQEDKLLRLVGVEAEIVWNADVANGTFPNQLVDVVRTT